MSMCASVELLSFMALATTLMIFEVKAFLGTLSAFYMGKNIGLASR